MRLKILKILSEIPAERSGLKSLKCGPKIPKIWSEIHESRLKIAEIPEILEIAESLPDIPEIR